MRAMQQPSLSDTLSPTDQSHRAIFSIITHCLLAAFAFREKCFQSNSTLKFNFELLQYYIL